MNRGLGEPSFRSMLVALVLLAVFVPASAGPARAERPAPEPEDLLIHPEAGVLVHDLPQLGPPPVVRGQKPIMFPDPDFLLETKQELRAPHAPPPPGPTALASVSGASVTTATPGFVGLQFSESGGYISPDTQVAAGPVNLDGRIWTKEGVLVRTFDLNSFFGLSGSARLSNPKIRNDPLSNRWFVLAIQYNQSLTSGAWLLAVSTDQSPLSFVRYAIATSKSAPDFPAIGINDDKVVLTANAFRGNSFVGTEFLVLNKAHLVGGVSTAAAYFAPPQGLFTIQPAHSLSTTCGTPGCPLYMAAVAFNSATSVRVWSIRGVPGAGVTSTTTNLAIATLSSPPDARQLGTSVLIQTNDNRLLDAAYRGGVLWVSANSACVRAQDTASRACLRFIKFSTAPRIGKNQDFDFGLAGRYFYYPAVQIDGGGNLVSVFSGSSASEWASVFASGQQTTDTPNSFRTPILVHAGESAYTPFASRWGDYSGAGVDPSNQ